MRAIISLFVTSLIVGSFAVESQYTAIADSATLDMTTSQVALGSKSKRPEQPTPHRGSGRGRAIVEYLAEGSIAV
jgi:hypothetical protein